MDVVLVLDVGAETIAVSRAIARGARLACSEFEQGDRLGLITFSETPTVVFTFTPGGVALGGSVERAVAAARGGRTARVYDALQAAVGLFPSVANRNRTRAVLIVTNTPDEYPKSHGSIAKPEDILVAARRKSVALFSASVSPQFGGTTPRKRDPDEFGYSAGIAASRLRTITEPTGGESRTWFPSGYLLRQYFERIRKRYVATYVALPGGSGRLLVRLTPRAAARFPDFVVRSVW